MLGRRARRERRLRERGVPAWATVTAVEDAGGGVWGLGLRVVPGIGEPFDAHAEVTVSDPSGPAVGGRLEVLHERGRAGPVLAVGEPSRPLLPAPAGAPAAGGPDVATVLSGLARALGDGSLARGMPVIVTDDAPAPPSPVASGSGPLAGLSLDALAARAGDDPRAVLDEATRRVGAGEATMGEILAAARRAGLGGGDLARIIAARRPPPR